MSNFKVISPGLNLRSEPRVSPDTRLSVLTQGHIVAKISVATTNEKWWLVATSFRGNELKGFVAHRFLAPVSEVIEPPGQNKIVPVHMQENRPEITRNRDGGRAFPLGEPNRPIRQEITTSEKAAELTKIIEWLAVKKNKRYKRKPSATYCNIYAYDYCYLAGVYLPRVWWKSSAIAKLAVGKVVIPKYGVTILELNANSLHDWLDEFGEKFGWESIFNLTEIQTSANAGEVVVICAQRRNLNYSGHICLVVPETENHNAEWKNGKVVKLLQSQAGSKNFRYTTLDRWWASSKYRNFGFWKHV